MTEIIKESVTTQEGAQTTPTIVEPKVTSSQTVEYIIYFLSGFLEILLVFRLILKMTGANMGGMFVNFIYSLTGIFITPFRGIFSQAVSPGIENTAVFEPATLIAIIVYAVLSFGIVKLFRILSGKKPQEN